MQKSTVTNPLARRDSLGLFALWQRSASRSYARLLVKGRSYLAIYPDAPYKDVILFFYHLQMTLHILFANVLALLNYITLYNICFVRS